MQQMLPQYEFMSLLGRGGMGAVYLAMQTSLDRPVAIKVLPGELNDNLDVNFAQRFKNEARTLARMNHPAIVSVYDFGETSSGLLYIVMEFIDGTDVAQIIISQGKLTAEHALSITAHVCDALFYAHNNGVVHRDIKPANIILNSVGAVKVVDFGLAKHSDPALLSGLTKSNIAMGTPDFVAPEAFIPGMPLDGRADLYAVGVMLYQMLTGEIPRGMWIMPGLKLGTDHRFDAIIAKAMQTDREARYQTAAEIRRDLDSILSTPILAGKDPAPSSQIPAQLAARTPAPMPQPVVVRRFPMPLVVGAGVAIAVLGIGASFFFKPAADQAEKRAAVNGADARQGEALSPQATGSAGPQGMANNVRPSESLPPFSSFVKSAKWHDRLAPSESWSRSWERDGTTIRAVSEVAFQSFAGKVRNAGLRVRYRAQEKSHLDLVLRNSEPDRYALRYVCTLVTGNKFNSVISAETQTANRHLLANPIAHPPAMAGVVHSAEFYVIDDQLTLFFDGELCATARDAALANGYTAVYAKKDVHLIQVESADLGDSVHLQESAPLAPGPSNDGTAWTNLLSKIEVQRNSVWMPWTIDSGGLHSPLQPISRETPGGHTSIILADSDFPAEYDFRCRVTRESPGSAMMLIFPANGTNGAVMIDGGYGFRIRQGGDFPVRNEKAWFQPGASHEMRLEVRENLVRAFYDGQLVFEWKEPVQALFKNDFFPMASARKPLLGIGVCRGQITVHSAELRPVKTSTSGVTPARRSSGAALPNK